MKSLHLDQFREILKDQCKLDLSFPVILGVSGGPDSLCLLHLLWTLQIPLIVGHFDHQLRAESAQEAEAVKRLAQAWKLQAIIGSEDVLSMAKRDRLSLEEAARVARYRFLFSQARQNNAQAVLVAHNADDQVESVLMHFLRGTGTSGLRGMDFYSLPNPWSEQIPLVRPLLATWREEIDSYLKEHGLVPCQDPSNLDERFYRNYLRHNLIPLLEKNHPQFRQRLWRMAEVIRADAVVLDQAADEAWKKCCAVQGNGFVGFHYPAILDLNISLQRIVFRRAMNLLQPSIRDLDFSTIEAATDFLRHPTRTHQRDLAAGIRLYLEEDMVWLAKWEADIPCPPGTDLPQQEPSQVQFLQLPGEIFFKNGWRLCSESIPNVELARQEAEKNTNPWVAWMDADRLQLPLFVRTCQPGDRFQPLGMHGHGKKLSDFMINLKIPQRARKRFPLVLSGEQVAWIPGFRLAEFCRIVPETTRVIKLMLKKPG